MISSFQYSSIPGAAAKAGANAVNNCSMLPPNLSLKHFLFSWSLCSLFVLVLSNCHAACCA